MNKAHRLFGPKFAQRRSVPGKPAQRGVEPVAQDLANDLAQDLETAERNAQEIAHALKRALKRRKASRIIRPKFFS